jgi:hypothetical protein
MVNAGCVVRSSLVVVSLLLMAGLGRAGAETHVRAVAAQTGTILLDPELQPAVEAMLQQSPTFRQQYERIASAPKLIITARVDIKVVHRSFRARSHIRRYDSGLIVVTMEIAPDAVNPEWIAHEFEHILEQLDGVNVAAQALQRRSGSWYSTGEMVETSRAMKAGRVVRDEMRGRRDRSDNFVE